MSAPLEGVSVVEFAQEVAGPNAASYLADLGARVIKVETPDGDPTRSGPSFAAWNRSKTIRVLDLTRPDAVDTLRETLDGTDLAIVDESWLRRFASAGIDLNNAIGPHTVVCRLPLTDGPHDDDLPADEDAVAAATGLMTGQPGHHDGPSRHVFPVLGVINGMLAALGSLAGLYSRERTGHAGHLSVPMVATAAFLQGVVGATAKDPGGSSAAIRTPSALGQHATYRCYPTYDGWICITCTNPDFYSRLCISLDLEELLIDERFERAPWGVAPKDQRIQEVAITSRLATMTIAECMALFENYDVPAQPVSSLEEFLKGDIVERNRLLVPAATGWLPRFPATIGEWEQRSIGASVEAGEHQPDDATYEPHARHEDRGGNASSTGAELGRGPLDGLVVLDLSSYLAGPLCTSLLAELGAYVVKIEPPEGEGLRSSGLTCISINRGKRGLALDLRQPEGRQVLDEMISQADVVVTAFRPGVSDRLGLTAERLRQLNPGIISVRIDGYGDVPRLAHRPSFDPLIQAISGQMHLQGATADAPVCMSIAINDFGAGIIAALSTVALLRRRLATDVGGDIEVSQVAIALQFLAGHVAAKNVGTSMPLDPLRSDVLHGVYRTGDGYVSVHADNAAEALEWLGLDETTSDDAIASAMAEKLLVTIESSGSNRPRSVHIVPLADPFYVRPELPIFRASNAIWDFSHRFFGEVRSAGTVLKFDGSTLQTRAGPYIGEHNDQILTRFGFGHDRITDFYERRLIASPIPDWITPHQPTNSGKSRQ
ncbi:MAG: CoA transferase [Acidimicrobiales bacterium]